MSENHLLPKTGRVLATACLTVLVGAAALTSGCSRDPDVDVEVIEIRTRTTEQRRELIDAARQRLAAADEQLRELENQLETASLDDRASIEVRVKTLRVNRESTSDKLDRLGQAAEETWDSIWRDVGHALDDLDAKLKKKK